MASLNSYNFTGRLGRDPELRSTSGGTQVCSLAVAVDTFGDRETVWVDVSVFGKAAESCARFLAKGREVAVSGSVDEVRAFQKRDGQPGAALQVSTRDVSFIGGRGDDAPAPRQAPASDVPDVGWGDQPDTRDFQPAQQGSLGGQGDDDIPF